MYHMFDVEVAKQVGIVAAVIFQNITFWCLHSKANGTNFYEGRFWTYNSVKAFKEMFPYLSKSQIDTAIKKLLDSGLIVKGNFNKSTYDRTAWYAVTEIGNAFLKNQKSISEKSEMEKLEIGNGFPENRKPIPDINTDISTDINPDNGLLPGFAEFWKCYPHKVKKASAIKAWKSGKCEAISDIVIEDVRKRLETEWKGQDLQYIQHPTTYLHQRRWEDETPPQERQDAHGRTQLDRNPKSNPALNYTQREYEEDEFYGFVDLDNIDDYNV